MCPGGVVAQAQFGADLAQDGGPFCGQGRFGRGARGLLGHGWVDGGREGARLVGAPPGGQFEDGFSGVVELPGLGLELVSLLIEEGVEGLGERLGQVQACL